MLTETNCFKSKNEMKSLLIHKCYFILLFWQKEVTKINDVLIREFPPVYFLTIYTDFNLFLIPNARQR